MENRNYVKPLKNVIVALDLENRDEAFQLIDTLAERISIYKIGPQLFTRSGPEVISFLHRRRKKIFIDLKLHDTPQVVFETIRQLAELGVDFATVHCLGGKKMLESASQGCRGSKLQLLGITLLTSFDPTEATYWGWDTSAEESVPRLAELAQEMRLSGIVCSVSEAAQLRPRVSPEFLLITPGIRPQRIEVYQEDQKRIASPEEAFAAGADYLIVGRPIIQSRDPILAAETIFEKV